MVVLVLLGDLFQSLEQVAPVTVGDLERGPVLGALHVLDEELTKVGGEATLCEP